MKQYKTRKHWKGMLPSSPMSKLQGPRMLTCYHCKSTEKGQFANKTLLRINAKITWNLYIISKSIEKSCKNCRFKVT